MNRLLLILLPLLLLGACTGEEQPEAGAASVLGDGTSATASGAPAAADPPATPAAADPAAASTAGGAAATQAGGGRGGGGGSPPPVIGRVEGLSRSRIDFELTHIDLGQLYQQELRDLAYPFQLAGPDDVILLEPEVSCGCTEPSLEVEGEPWAWGKPIPAGSKGRVLAIFDSKLYSATKSSSIRVIGNAINLPVQLTIDSYILPLFQVSPRMARFDNLLSLELRRNKQPTRELEITGAKPFEIVTWKDLPEWLQIEEIGEPRTADDGVGQVRTLRVGLNPEVPLGRHSTMAEAETTLGKALAVQVYAEVNGPVRFFPERLPRFGIVEQGSENQIRTVSIRATQDRLPVPAPFFDYEGPDGIYEITLDEKKPGLRYDLNVRLLPEAPEGRHDGKIKLSWPEAEGIPVPLEAREFDLQVIIAKPR